LTISSRLSDLQFHQENIGVLKDFSQISNLSLWCPASSLVVFEAGGDRSGTMPDGFTDRGCPTY
jgi:hypothetical protein